MMMCSFSTLLFSENTRENVAESMNIGRVRACQADEEDEEEVDDADDEEDDDDDDDEDKQEDNDGRVRCTTFAGTSALALRAICISNNSFAASAGFFFLTTVFRFTVNSAFFLSASAALSLTNAASSSATRAAAMR